MLSLQVRDAAGNVVASTPVTSIEEALALAELWLVESLRVELVRDVIDR